MKREKEKIFLGRCPSGAIGLALSAAFALFAAPLLAAPAAVTRGLTVALSFEGSGRSVVSGPYILRVPGTKGSLKVVFDGAALENGLLDAPVRLVNETGADLLAVRLDLLSASETVRRGEGAEPETRELSLSSGPPLAWGAIPVGAETPADLFRGGPFVLSKDTEVLVVLGAVSGLAAVPADPKADARIPATKATECPPQPSPCRVDAEGNLWRLEPAYGGRRGGLSERTRGGAAVRSLWFADGEKPVDLSLAKDGRLLVFFDDGSKDGAVRAYRPF